MKSDGLGRLCGKTAVVTGATKGLGRATTELFAREGARLVITGVGNKNLTGLRDRLTHEISVAETLRLDEFPNVLCVLVYDDKGLARDDRGVDMRAARAYELGVWFWWDRRGLEPSVALSACLRGVT